MTTQEVIANIDNFLITGDEKGARKFLADNLSQMPQELRDQLSWGFLEDSIQGEQFLLSFKRVAADTLETSTTV